MSPDGKTVIFARRHNLFMMDADNYAKALKKADDASIVETQITTDGEDNYSYARTQREILQQREQEQQQRQEDGEIDQQDTERDDSMDENARMPAIAIVWSRDSNRFALVRRDARKVKDLWVINALSTPRPTLESYRYAMPGEEYIPQSEMHVFDRGTRQRVSLKGDRFKDQTLAIATAPSPTTSNAIRGVPCRSSG